MIVPLGMLSEEVEQPWVSIFRSSSHPYFDLPVMFVNGGMKNPFLLPLKDFFDQKYGWAEDSSDLIFDEELVQNPLQRDQAFFHLKTEPTHFRIQLTMS